MLIYIYVCFSQLGGVTQGLQSLVAEKGSIDLLKQVEGHFGRMEIYH